MSDIIEKLHVTLRHKQEELDAETMLKETLQKMNAKLVQEIESLQGTVDQLTRTPAACCNARDLTADERDKLKRRAKLELLEMLKAAEWFEEK